MTKYILVLLSFSSPAFAQNVYCIDGSNPDNIIELVVDNGQVRGATFSSESDGSVHNRPLRPEEYRYNGSTVIYSGDTYNCQ